jgi:hypothetical protein
MILAGIIALTINEESKFNEWIKAFIFDLDGVIVDTKYHF